MVQRMRPALQYFHNAHFRAKQNERQLQAAVLQYVRNDHGGQNRVTSGFKVRYMLNEFKPFPNSWQDVAVLQYPGQDKTEIWIQTKEEEDAPYRPYNSLNHCVDQEGGELRRYSPQSETPYWRLRTTTMQDNTHLRFVQEEGAGAGQQTTAWQVWREEDPLA